MNRCRIDRNALRRETDTPVFLMSISVMLPFDVVKIIFAILLKFLILVVIRVTRFDPSGVFHPCAHEVVGWLV